MRPPKHGPEVILRDIMHLERILRRVYDDSKRDPSEKKRLVKLLVETITLLHTSKRAKRPFKKAA